MNRDQIKNYKREAAEQRQAAHDALTPEQKLAKLERGGHGHCKEAVKLRALIEEA